MVLEPAIGTFLQVQTGSFSDLRFPLGVVAVLALGVLFGIVRVAMIQGTGQSEGPSPDERTNCPACGARTPIGEANCEYCGQPVFEDH